MSIYQLIKPLGILTYLIVLLAVVSGLYLTRLHLKLVHHKTIALIAIAMATLHGLLVLLLW